MTVLPDTAGSDGVPVKELEALGVQARRTVKGGSSLILAAGIRKTDPAGGPLRHPGRHGCPD